MKVLDCRVNWMEKWDNKPYLELMVDRIPEDSEMIFEQKDDLFYAEKDGYVRFFYYSQPGNGFGGARYPITMKDGSEMILKGPWSSRAGCMNNAGFKPSLDVVITNDKEAFDRGYTFLASHATLEICEKAVEKFCPEVMLKEEDYYGETCYHPVLKDGRRKPDPQTGVGIENNLWKK